MLILAIFLFPYCVFGELAKESGELALESWDACFRSRLIVGGKEIDIREAPYQLVLEVFNIEQLFWQFSCGAAIITHGAAITAGHCVVKFYPDHHRARLKAGTADREYGEIHYIRKIVIHEQYDFRSQLLDHDIALLFVFRFFQYSDRIQPIKLPTEELPVGTEVTVTGWGFQKPKVTNESDRYLRKVIVPIVDRQVCKKLYEKHKEIDNNWPFKINSDDICAGYPSGKFDACQGDSGGPLVHNNTLYGIVSWGLGCADRCMPGVYVNMVMYAFWVEDCILKDRLGLPHLLPALKDQTA